MQFFMPILTYLISIIVAATSDKESSKPQCKLTPDPKAHFTVIDSFKLTKLIISLKLIIGFEIEDVFVRVDSDCLNYLRCSSILRKDYFVFKFKFKLVINIIIVEVVPHCSFQVAKRRPLNQLNRLFQLHLWRTYWHITKLDHWSIDYLIIIILVCTYLGQPWRYLYPQIFHP